MIVDQLICITNNYASLDKSQIKAVGSYQT